MLCRFYPLALLIERNLLSKIYSFYLKLWKLAKNHRHDHNFICIWAMVLVFGYFFGFLAVITNRVALRIIYILFCSTIYLPPLGRQFDVNSYQEGMKVFKIDKFRSFRFLNSIEKLFRSKKSFIYYTVCLHQKLSIDGSVDLSLIR